MIGSVTLLSLTLLLLSSLVWLLLMLPSSFTRAPFNPSVPWSLLLGVSCDTGGEGCGD